MSIKIEYSRDGDVERILFEGTAPEMLSGVVAIIDSLARRYGLNTDRLAATLPFLLRLKAQCYESIESIDLSAIERARTAQKGGDGAE